MDKPLRSTSAPAIKRRCVDMVSPEKDDWAKLMADCAGPGVPAHVRATSVLQSIKKKQLDSLRKLIGGLVEENTKLKAENDTLRKMVERRNSLTNGSSVLSRKLLISTQYQIFRAARVRKRGGGVAVMVKSPHSACIVFNESVTDSYEILTCGIWFYSLEMRVIAHSSVTPKAGRQLVAVTMQSSNFVCFRLKIKLPALEILSRPLKRGPFGTFDIAHMVNEKYEMFLAVLKHAMDWFIPPKLKNENVLSKLPQYSSSSEKVRHRLWWRAVLSQMASD
ncbi:hypothetical protein OSTOST_01519 [Ostertagia ostertagi]